MNKLNKKGFSLIELLIVIAIIGILSTIVLNNLSQSKIKAYDSQVKVQLRGFRAAAENYFNSQNPASYGPAAINCGSGMFADVDPQHGSPAFYLDSRNLPNNTDLLCESTGGVDSDYAVKASLYSNPNNYWCVDSRGFVGELVGPQLRSRSCNP